MKFIYTLIIGLVLFNGFLLAFSGFFPQSPYDSENTNIADVAENETLSGYRTGIVNLGSFGVNMLFTGAVTMGIIGTILIISTIIGKGYNLPLYMGIGLVIGVISSLWLITTKVLTPMFNYEVVREIYTVITVVIGILVVIGLGDMATQRSDSDL